MISYWNWLHKYIEKFISEGCLLAAVKPKCFSFCQILTLWQACDSVFVPVLFLGLKDPDPEPLLVVRIRYRIWILPKSTKKPWFLLFCEFFMIFLSLKQGCGSAFISSGSGSSILGWTHIRIQYESGSRALMTKNWKKITTEKFFFFGSKTTIYLSLGLHKERPSYRRSLQLSKEAIQHFKTWTFQKKFYFCGSFLPSWIRIRIPNQDPLTRLNPDPIRIRNPALKTEVKGKQIRKKAISFYILRATEEKSRIRIRVRIQTSVTQ